MTYRTRTFLVYMHGICVLYVELKPIHISCMHCTTQPVSTAKNPSHSSLQVEKSVISKHPALGK